jgi:uncharacterized UPF0160 family protein
LNPAWNEQNYDEDALFRAAMAMVGKEFDDKVNYYLRAWWPAMTIVQEAINGCIRADDDRLKEIAILERSAPWKDHFFTIEQELNIEGQIKFVVFESTDKETWRVQAVPVSRTSFESR